MLPKRTESLLFLKKWICRKIKQVFFPKQHKIEDLKIIEFNAFRVYDGGYINIKIRTYGDNFCTNFRGLDVPEDGVECKCFPVISIGSLLVYDSKYYLQVYLVNCAYKVVEKQMTDYLDDNIFQKEKN